MRKEEEYARFYGNVTPTARTFPSSSKIGCFWSNRRILTNRLYPPLAMPWYNITFGYKIKIKKGKKTGVERACERGRSCC
jgi:hypothetical protein